MSRDTAIVIGGGIAGLATAALLAADGHSVTLLEARSELGGRAGNWERDGFRFDTGPSWYLMPEVFDHFFRLLGTSAEAELDLVPLNPAYRVYTRATLSPSTSYRARGGDRLFESVEPGAGARLDAYLDSARTPTTSPSRASSTTPTSRRRASATPPCSGACPRSRRC